MTGHYTRYLLALVVVLTGMFYAATASAHGWVMVGDRVWYDADCDGVQNDGADSGLNGIRVDFWRDYDCNGLIDGYDEYYDYDFTHNDASGLPGYYDVPADGGFCFVASLDGSTIPEGLHITTAEEVTIRLNGVDYTTADFGLGDCPEEPPAFACGKTIGFWKQQVQQSRAAKYTAAEVDAIEAEALNLTVVFADAYDLETALLSKGNAGLLQHARRQFAGLVLNLAAYNLYGELGYAAGLDEREPLFLPELTDALFVGEAFNQVEIYILNRINLGLANNIADAINNGLGIDVYCPEN